MTSRSTISDRWNFNGKSRIFLNVFDIVDTLTMNSILDLIWLIRYPSCTIISLKILLCSRIIASVYLCILSSHYYWNKKLLALQENWYHFMTKIILSYNYNGVVTEFWFIKLLMMYLWCNIYLLIIYDIEFWYWPYLKVIFYFLFL